MQSGNSFLSFAFRNAGIELTEREGWLTTNDEYPMCKATARTLEQTLQRVRMGVDVEIALSAERIIVESFGVSDGNEQQTLTAFSRDFSQSVLPVVVETVWKKSMPPPTGPAAKTPRAELIRGTLSQPGRAWNIAWGPGCVKASLRGIPSLPPPEIVDTVEDLLVGRTLSAESHWVSLFYSRVSASETVAEVRVDNQLWPACGQAIEQLAWPKLDHAYYSFRMFGWLE